RDTLTALFCTELRSAEIVRGKLLGRLAVLAQVLVIPLPPLMLLAVLGDMSPGRVLLAVAQAAVLTFALAAACMLASVWAGHTLAALRVFSLAAPTVSLAGITATPGVPVPAWINPVEVLRRLANPSVTLNPALILAHLGLWLGVGLVLLRVATARMRP